MLSKKGEYEGKAVGVLILLIALLMTLYIIFIPPEDREQLLNPNNASSSSISNSVEKLELLSETPGMVSTEQQQKTEHNLMPINLFIKNDPKTFNLAQSLIISKGLFSKSFPILFFNLDKNDLKKVTLFFSVAESQGILRVSVNGNQFYAESLQPSVKIIEIPTEFLVEKNNKLEFVVSSPGLAFWSSNQYTLTNVGIKQEFELINSMQERKFTMSRIEKDSLEKAELSYFQVCNLKLPKTSVPLKIYINGNPIPALSTRITCLSRPQTTDIDTKDLIAGQNSVLFVLEEAGDFTFNEVKLIADAKQSDYPQYTFPLSKDQYDAIIAGTKKAQLELYLETNQQSKNARISVNAGDIFMQTKANTFTYNLKEYIEQGSNFIRIVPNNDFVINGLKVTLQ